ncbi:MAG: hypothetical protein NVS9B10_15130 [Nevskia sp.]
MHGGFGEREKPHWQSVLTLIGHMIGTAVIFVSMFGIGWSVSFLLEYLNSIHKFPSDIYGVVTAVELYFLYADVLLCGVVLCAGAIRFIKELTR